ncbi:MAG: hypothetical protein MJ156_01780 [Alphaproteobacteria bacterium]|nr:hypothetical protein [Alphaproteobacteria bacterium]
MELFVGIPVNKSHETNDLDITNSKTLNNLVIKPIEHVSYYTDTIAEVGPTLLFYSNGNITRLYKDGESRYKMQLPYFSHENWHHHNDNLKYRYCKQLSTQEYVKLCAWDEISANLCAILTARYEYLYAQNQQAIIKNYEKTYMSFYFNAIKSGKIKPSTSGITEEECKLLVNGTTNMWLKNFWPTYSDKIIKKLNTHIDIFGVKEGEHQEYTSFRDQMLTLGGVNFGNYLQKDIIIKNKTVLSIEQLYKVNSFKKDWKDIAINITQFKEQLACFSPQQQKQFIKHIVLSTKLKHILHDIQGTKTAINEPLVQNIYTVIEKNLQEDQSFLTWLNSIQVSDQSLTYYDPKTYYKQCIKNLYTYNNTNLMNVIGEKHLIEPNSYQYPFMGYQRIYPEIYTSFKELVEPQNVNTSSKYKNNTEHHKSDIQYIDLPDFSQPILTASNNMQKSQIKQIIRDFEDFPQVLKECDTKAQIKFLKQQSLTR